jgi:hypothetical protein
MGRPADVVERVLRTQHMRLDESLTNLRPDARWAPGAGQPVLRGHEEIRSFVAAELQRLGAEVPQVHASMLFERGDTVLAYGQLRWPRGGGGRRYTEVLPAAWVFELDGELIASVTAFEDWESAREAAGVPPGSRPTRRLSAELWHPAVGRLRGSLRWLFQPAPAGA